MIKNYFKTAMRNLAKNKVFSLINVAGLSIGISSPLVIFLIVWYDLGFDKFEKDRDRIYRVVSNFSFSGADNKGAVGLFVDNGTEGYFSGIKISKEN